MHSVGPYIEGGDNAKLDAGYPLIKVKKEFDEWVTI